MFCPPFSQSARFPNEIFTFCPYLTHLLNFCPLCGEQYDLGLTTKRDQFGCCCKTERMICVGVLNKSGKPIRRWVQSMKRRGDLTGGGSGELMKSDGSRQIRELKITEFHHWRCRVWERHQGRLKVGLMLTKYYLLYIVCCLLMGLLVL